MTNRITVFTRQSILARTQTQEACDAFATAHPQLALDIAPMLSLGDKHAEKPLNSFGGKTVFVKDLEAQLLAEPNAFAVHSLKDMSVLPHPELHVAAYLPREDTRDVLICRDPSHTLDTLPQGARIGTSSPRRTAQLLAYRSDLHILPIRGNLNTRLQKCQDGQYDAIVLAAAGLHRLNMQNRIGEYFSHTTMLPAIGQGIIALQCHRDNTELTQQLRAINHVPSEQAAQAEQAVNQVLGGDCHAAVAALAEMSGDTLTLNALVASLDGHSILHENLQGKPNDAAKLGKHVGEQLIAAGAQALLGQ